MRNKNYHTSRIFWSYEMIQSIDYFLEDFKDKLTEANLKNNIKIVQTYIDKFKTKKEKIIFNNISLEFKGIDEAVNIMRGLDSALYFFSDINQKK